MAVRAQAEDLEASPCGLVHILVATPILTNTATLQVAALLPIRHAGWLLDELPKALGKTPHVGVEGDDRSFDLRELRFGGRHLRLVRLPRIADHDQGRENPDDRDHDDHFHQSEAGLFFHERLHWMFEKSVIGSRIAATMNPTTRPRTTMSTGLSKSVRRPEATSTSSL